MQTIKDNVSTNIIIKRSKFIGYIYKVNSLNDIDAILEQLHNEYKDATHICYAYRLKSKEKAHDDKEPSGTAGIPILNILQKNDLVNVIAVVIRYFGGVKLGAGGLIRAYQNTIKDALDKTSIIPYKETIDIKVIANFSDEKLLKSICKNYKIINEDYSETITYTIEIDKDDIESIKNKTNNTNIKIVL